MQCDVCGKHLRIGFKEVRVDTLYKEYWCRNGHKTVYKRYGYIVEINSRKEEVNELFDFTEAARSEARKRRVRDLLQKTTFNKKV